MAPKGERRQKCPRAKKKKESKLEIFQLSITCRQGMNSQSQLDADTDATTTKNLKSGLKASFLHHPLFSSHNGILRAETARGQKYTFEGKEE